MLLKYVLKYIFPATFMGAFSSIYRTVLTHLYLILCRVYPDSLTSVFFFTSHNLIFFAFPIDISFFYVIIYLNNSRGGFYMFEMPKKGTLIAGVPFDPRKSGNKFEFIVYPDSAPSDWVDILKNQGFVFVVSPLHDKDISANGEPKKAHYHMLIVWPNSPTKWQTACGVCDTLNCPCCLPIANLRSKYDYLTHKNDPNKAQYNPNDILCVNGFSISNFEGLATDEVKRLVIELTKLCFDKCISEYSDLMHYLLVNDMHDAFDVASNRTVYFSNLCKGIWRKGVNITSSMNFDSDTGEVLNVVISND